MSKPVVLGVEQRVVELEVAGFVEGGRLVALAVLSPVEVEASANIDREPGLVALGGELLIPVCDDGADLGGLVALLVGETRADRELPAIRGLDDQVAHGVLETPAALLVANNKSLLVKEVLDLEQHTGSTTEMKKKQEEEGCKMNKSVK